MKLHIRNVRLSFPQLFEAKQVNEGGEPKFSASFLLPPDHPQLKDIHAAIQAVASEKWGAKAKGVLAQLAAADRTPIHSGDTKGGCPGYEGQFYINASSKTRPLVVDGQRTVLTASDGIPYPGCYVNALIEFWAQDNKFGKRINASLLGVQFAKHGERLSGGSVASVDDFDVIPDAGESDAPAGNANELF